jgi:hypothetical protein
MSDPLGIASEIGANDMVTPETEKKIATHGKKKRHCLTGQRCGLFVDCGR